MKRILLFTFFVASTSNYAQNLIQNAGFEQYTNNVPNMWNIEYGVAEQESTIYNEGNSSVKGILTSPTPNTSPLFWINQNFTLNDTDEYTLSFDYYIPGTIQTNYIDRVGFELSQLAPDDSFFFPQYPNITHEYGVWKTVSFDFKILAFRNGTTSAGIKLTLSAGTAIENNIINFDNVSIIKKSVLSNAGFNNDNSIIKLVSNDYIYLNDNYKSSIYSLDGKQITSSNSDASAAINISYLSKGIYILHVQNENRIKVVKFIKS